MVWTRLPTATVLACFSVAAQSPLDFDTYRSKVEPIFMKKRSGHARCVACHSAGNSAFRLQPLPEGAPGWTPEQSKQNFESVSRLVKPGDIAGSRLLKHPLAEDAGGDEFHSGGQQFKSKSDPDWQTIADWVQGKK
jgi:hypothetical protein